LITFCARFVSTRPRRWLQRLAGVPRYALREAAALAGGELTPNEAALKEARATLLSRGIDTSSDWLPPAEPVYRQLERATALFIQLRAWDDDPQFARFRREAKNEIEMLRRRFERLSFRVSRALTVIERLGEVRHRANPAGTRETSTPELDRLIKKIVNDLITEVCEDIRFFYEDTCLVATRGVLATQSTLKTRKTYLVGLGFAPSRPPLNSGYAILIPMAVLLYAGISLLFLILPPQVVDLNRKALIAVVSLTSFGALAMAIVPKLHWGFANVGLHERTPTVFILGSGLCAVLFAVLVNLGAGAWLMGGAHGALLRLEDSLPWMFGIFASAATMAWLIQDNRWQSSLDANKRRRSDAVVLGLAWLLATAVGDSIRAAGGNDMNYVYVLYSGLGSFVLGAVVGYIIPEFVRWTPTTPMLSTSLTNLRSSVSSFGPQPVDS